MNCGHYYTGKVYSLNDDKIIKDKAEYKALKWSYNVLIPFEDLKSAILKRN